MSIKLNINKILISNFLGDCKGGIAITQDFSAKAKAIIMMDEFSSCYDKDKLEIFNDEEGSSIAFSRLNEWDVKEHDDYMVIAKDDFIIRIEQML